MSDNTPDPLLVMHLRGTQAQMGAQLGQLLRDRGGYEHALEFYPKMASAMLSLAVPNVIRPAAREALRAALSLGARRLHRARSRLYPEYAARSEAMLKAGGISPKIGRSMVVMDILQNTVGTLGKAGLLHTTRLQVAAVPACTTLAVWDDASADGQLRHARNFDFPGAGVWDQAPTVVFCAPDDGLRYAYVTTRGADVPGVTAFNEAGLSLTAHTRFHRDVDFSSASIIDYGHDIIRRCRTLEDVRRVAREHRTASTWGLLVSSAEERSALVVETTSKGVAFSEPKPGASHLTCTNRYIDPGLSHGEINTSPSFPIYSDARYTRADQAPLRHRDGLSRADLEALLDDTGDPGAPDAEADDRLTGNCICTPMTVQSVVFEPESANLRMSVGPAPTGGGPWIDVPHDWDAPVGANTLPTRPAANDEPAPSARRAAQLLFVEATKANLDGASPKKVLELMERAVDAAPTEPNLRFLAAMFALSTNDFATASAHLEHALRREQGSYRRSLLLLWHGRVLAATGRHDQAKACFDALAGMPGEEAAHLRAAGAKESKRPVSKLRLRMVVPDMFLVDGALPGQ